MLGSHGIVKATQEYLQAVRKLAEDLALRLILDEVRMFRLDTGGSHTLCGISLNLTAMAMIIAVVFLWELKADGRRSCPSLTLGTPRRLSHGGTFNGIPMVMAPGQVTMQHWTDAAVTCINHLGDRLRTGIQNVAVEQCSNFKPQERDP